MRRAAVSLIRLDTGTQGSCQKGELPLSTSVRIKLLLAFSGMSRTVSHILDRNPLTSVIYLHNPLKSVAKGFTVHHDMKLSELSFTFWINYWWGDPILMSNGSPVILELYRQFIKADFHTSAGSHLEWVPYPVRCAYLEPGSW
jgi:hypothetical protein